MDESAPEAEKQELLSVWEHERNSFRSLEAGIKFLQVFYWDEAAPEILRNILLIDLFCTQTSLCQNPFEIISPHPRQIVSSHPLRKGPLLTHQYG